MLDKRNRLTKRGSFTYVYKHGRSMRSGAVTLSFVLAKAGVRIGFSVSNRAGKAVVRNKIRRRMRSVMRELAANLKPCQAVFGLNRDAGTVQTLSHDVLRADMVRALERAGLFLPKDGAAS